MKKSLLCVLLLIMVTSINAQYDTIPVKLTNKEMSERLMLKSRKQRTTGLVLLASGLAMEAIAIATYPKDYDFIFGTTPEKEKNATLSSILFVAGAAAWISSIPVLISGRVNQRKARLLLRTEQVTISPQFKTSQWQYKTGIAINF
jgi:hypothetical protein